MADMLDFMYRGEANVRQEDLAAFLKLAETLKVKGLAGDKAEVSIVCIWIISPLKEFRCKIKLIDF